MTEEKKPDQRAIELGDKMADAANAYSALRKAGAPQKELDDAYEAYAEARRQYLKHCGYKYI